MAGIAAGLLLVAALIAGRLMVGLTTPIVSSAPLQQSTPTPTNTPVPDLKLSPSTAVANQTVTLTGTNFTSPITPGGGGVGGVHQITGAGDSLITLAEVALDSSAVEYPVDLDSGGNLLVTVVIPISDATIADGSLVMKVTDSFGQSDTATLKIPQRSLTVTPDEGPRGSVVTAKGTGFPASNPRTTTQSVKLTYDGTSVGTATTDAEGDFETTFNVPLTAGIPSSNTVTATGVGTTGTAIDGHKVASPKVELTPESAAFGATIAINGTGFPGFSTATTVDIGDLSVLPSPPPRTLADGLLSISVLVPQLDLGVQVVRLTVGGVSAIATFTIVAPDPTATPVPTATPLPIVDTATGLAPLSDNLVRVWSFDNSTKEWSYYDPRPIFASANTVTQLVRGQIYWIKIDNAQTVTLNGSERTLFVGWNLLAW
ncbi:MAG: hypothetical protein BZY80_03810 [SAR202 cluster bacterium Io17-Chloro-G2]|nr:MAG: hypothetical protein BZY80_03810 [SAR202 cluster bacterium Io17-Chloro-G2]